MNSHVPITQLQPIVSSSGTNPKCVLREVITTPLSLDVLICQVGRIRHVVQTTVLGEGQFSSYLTVASGVYTQLLIQRGNKLLEVI